MPSSKKDAIERRDEAIELLEENEKCVGVCEKAWLIDRLARTLLGDEYEQWVEAYEKNGRDFPIRRWLTGTKPYE